MLAKYDGGRPTKPFLTPVSLVHTHTSNWSESEFKNKNQGYQLRKWAWIGYTPLKKKTAKPEHKDIDVLAES